MNTKNKVLMTAIIGFSLVMVVFLVGVSVYFNTKEINNASERCYEIGGMPTVETSFLTINYSFSCEVTE